MSLRPFWTIVFPLLPLAAGCDNRLAPARHDDHEQHDEQSESRGGRNLVHISPDAIERMGIRFATVEGAPAQGGIEVPAEIQLEPDREAHVSTIVSGQLAAVMA